jgi:peptidoglycan/LPS O-acetylase OafA/YrhL
LMAALVLSMVTPRREWMLGIISGALAMFGVCLTAIGFLQHPTAVIALLVVCGAAMVLSLALCNTMIQQRVIDSMRGRVMSMYTFSFFAFIPFGNLMAGILAEERGIAHALVVLGSALVVTGIAVGAIGRRASS